VEVSAAKALWMSDHATHHSSDLFVTFPEFRLSKSGKIAALVREI